MCPALQKPTRHLQINKTILTSPHFLLGVHPCPYFSDHGGVPGLHRTLCTVVLITRGDAKRNKNQSAREGLTTVWELAHAVQAVHWASMSVQLKGKERSKWQPNFSNQLRPRATAAQQWWQKSWSVLSDSCLRHRLSMLNMLTSVLCTLV